MDESDCWGKSSDKEFWEAWGIHLPPEGPLNWWRAVNRVDQAGPGCSQYCELLPESYQDGGPPEGKGNLLTLLHGQPHGGEPALGEGSPFCTRTSCPFVET